MGDEPFEIGINARGRESEESTTIENLPIALAHQHKHPEMSDEDDFKQYHPKVISYEIFDLQTYGSQFEGQSDWTQIL